MITQPTSISLGNFATALNTYLASQPANTLVDVPMTVTLNRQAEVMLTNLALSAGQSNLNFTAAQISDRSGAAQVIGLLLNGVAEVVTPTEWTVYLPTVLR